MTCIDARHAHQALSLPRSKTDRNDARGLAEPRRVGWYTEVYVRTVETQHIRSMMNARYQLRRCRTEILNQMRGIVEVFGLYTGSTAKRPFLTILREIATEDPMAAKMLPPLLNAFHGLRKDRSLDPRPV